MNIRSDQNSVSISSTQKTQIDMGRTNYDFKTPCRTWNKNQEGAFYQLN